MLRVSQPLVGSQAILWGTDTQTHELTDWLQILYYSFHVLSLSINTTIQGSLTESRRQTKGKEI
jgi:hypothetical protein